MAPERPHSGGTERPHERYPALAERRVWLGRLLPHHQELVKRFLAAGGAIFPLDLFMLGIANRSYFLVDAFIDAFDKWNVYVAAPLVRLQLDNLVRTHYLGRVRNPHDFAVRLIKGEEFRRIKHNDGRYLTDRKLVRLSEEVHPWIEPVYEDASGWIHLSPVHLRANLSVDEAKSTLTMAFRRQSEIVPEDFLARVLGAMTRATEEVFGYIEVWEDRKENPQPFSPGEGW